jgi:dienelactone hydrolase
MLGPARSSTRCATLLAVALALAATGCATPRSAAVAPPYAVPGALEVRFPSRDGAAGAGGTQLVGWLFRPQGPGPFPAIVALHGCNGLYGRGGGDLSRRHRDWAERWAKAGYVVLLPDSFTSRGVDQICSRRDRPIRPARERSADAYGALAYLQTLPFVRADRVALVGWSNGGSTVLASVGADATARPPGDAPDFRTAIAFYPGCNIALRDPSWLPLAVPLHVLIGASDDWTPAAPCRALAGRAADLGQPMNLTVYDGAYHDFDAPGLRLRLRRNVATTASGTAHLGTNEPARAAASERVEAILSLALRDGW